MLDNRCFYPGHCKYAPYELKSKLLKEGGIGGYMGVLRRGY